MEKALYQACILLMKTNENNMFENCCFLFSEFKISYKLPVADISFLIHQKGSEEILFLEGFGNGDIDTIRIKAIVESQPDLR